MNFIKGLFRQEKAAMEYVETKHQVAEINIQDMPKDQVKPYLVQSLAPEYWDSSSSLVKYEVSNISSQQEIDDRIQQLDHYLQITSHGLFLEVMDHYDNFLSGLDNIQKINSLLEQSQILAKSSREDVEKMQAELAVKYLRVVYLTKRQERLNGLIGELKKFEEICYAVSLNIKQAIRQGNLYEALQLCNEAAVKLTTIDVSKYKALTGIVEIAEKRKGKVYVKMQSTLRQLCHKFDSHLYENVLLCYMTIATYEDINKALQAEFMNSVSRLIKESIEETVPHIPSSSIERMVKIIPVNNYLLTLRTILKKLTTLMYNHHLLSRWHEENE